MSKINKLYYDIFSEDELAHIKIGETKRNDTFKVKRVDKNEFCLYVVDLLNAKWETLCSSQSLTTVSLCMYAYVKGIDDSYLYADEK